MSQTEQYVLNYDSQYLDVFGCMHNTKIAYSGKLICQQCGIFISNSQTRVYKTIKMRYNAFFNPMNILNNALAPQIIQKHQINRSPVIDFIEQASERLNLSATTQFLAIAYLDHYFNKQGVNEEQIYLYAATALMLAAKAQELDEKIPFISKLKRYSSMTSHPEINNYTTQDFRNAEKSIIQSLDWKLQRITLLDRIETLLSFGVIDDDDSLAQQQSSQQKENKEQQQVHVKLKDLNETQICNYVREVENKYVEIAFTVLRGMFKMFYLDDSIYFSNDQSILALSCVAYLRKKAGLLNIWSQQLYALTGESTQKISSTVSQILTLTPKSKVSNLSKPLVATQSSSYLQNFQNPSSQTKSSQANNRQYLLETNKQSTGDIFQQYNTTKASVKVPLFQSQSTMQLSKNDIVKPHQLNQSKYTSRNTNFPTNTTTTTNYTYLNDQIFHPNSYIKHVEMDKKYEQVHKVSETKFRTKLFNQ
ncbi:unnamed protein product (macronuclear) [Paramecium tetraurelia]|uniref:Cyclin-like domain-containing protein n=1 Tax=Paramecium tetraurelia TaxID=5888 RepID=A0BHJ8_PARTE|nr:uncharacterized protein GSPATT00029050001 [Paramecium tetraurelia]CAK58015.1 unnamed protein product [Paramecium tetraurelia]|eukprot:XP_001425413.1 hypothetical protein (macronuclear) [Paramecium tetraurelia strain d4-2]